MRNFIREKKIYCGKEYMEVDIIPRSELQDKTVKGRRAKRKRESAPKQKNLNDKNTKRYLTQLANGNFGEDDLHVTCTYSDKWLPGTIEEAEKEVTNFLRRISHKRKSEGIETLKYILVTEYSTDDENEDKPIRIHHHILMNKGISRDDIEGLWSKRKKKGQKKGERLGFINADRLQPNENGLEAISKYLTKGRSKKGKKKWSSSRNLIRPESRTNDYKYSKRKVEIAAKENDERFWEVNYPSYRITEVKKVYEELTGWHIYLKMWKKE